MTTTSIPSVLDSYALLEQVSLGGMAEVWRGRRLGDPSHPPGPWLAVKRLLPHLCEDPVFVTMFEAEARLGLTLASHPNIVRTLDAGQRGMTRYLVMEYMSGRTLLEILRDLRAQGVMMSPIMAATIARELAVGLDALHRATDAHGRPLNIVHRDLSPPNVMVSWRGEVKLLDLGVARSEVWSDEHEPGVIKGKLGYLSPEQIQSKPLDGRSDIYLLGVMFWELLTSQRCFQGASELARLEQMMEARIEPPSSVAPHVPSDLDAIVMTCLRRDPHERFVTAGALASAISAALTGAPALKPQDIGQWLQSLAPEAHAAEQAAEARLAHIHTIEQVRQLAAERLGVTDSDDGDAQAPDATRIAPHDPRGQLVLPDPHARRRVVVAAVAVTCLLVLTVATIAMISRLRDADPAPPSQTTGEATVAVPGKPPRLALTIEPALTDGLQILVDGRAQIPPASTLTITLDEPGPHHIVVRLPGHEPFERVVRFKPGQLVPVHAALKPSP